ncbi:MAG TPA: TIGR03032 family protein [Humisphaera sp.]
MSSAPDDPPAAPTPLRSVFTQGLPELLRRWGVSVLVSTYQAGKLIVLREDAGAVNTHFRTFAKPMGIAAAGGRLAVGTAVAVEEFHDVPDVARRLPPAGRHDACFLPRRTRTTGDVQVHDLAWGGAGGDELWLVNTRFSCLCTLDDRHSFVPRWRPPFVSRLAAEDRCHLNGLAMDGAEPRYVTALGETDTPGGWRGNKAAGGVVIDVATGEAVLRGLSMPHSPRLHDGRLWLLNSGDGTIGFADPTRAAYTAVADPLPGFTRGLDFVGPYAFIGLSQVRESATFSGISIASRPESERCCGVWVVDTRTGRTTGFVRFEEGVREIFAVQVLTGVRYPDVVNDDRAVIADSFVVPDDMLDAAD